MKPRRAPPNPTIDTNRAIRDELAAWDPDYLPDVWLWLRQWSRRPRRIFWALDVRTGRWKEVT